MNFAVVGEHRDFFRKNQWIEFEGILNPSQLDLILKEIASVLAARLKGPLQDPTAIAPEKAFIAGRDLWRSSAHIKKIALNKNLGEVAAEVVEQRPIRFGYDQLLPAAPYNFVASNSYSEILMKTLSLNEISSLQGVLCGAMICLVPPEGDSLTAPFSQKAGNGIFFSPDMPIPFGELTKQSKSLYLMLAYTKASTVYFKQENDPLGPSFKLVGYNFGDKLTDKLNPVIFQ